MPDHVVFDTDQFNLEIDLSESLTFTVAVFEQNGICDYRGLNAICETRFISFYSRLFACVMRDASFRSVRPVMITARNPRRTDSAFENTRFAKSRLFRLDLY